MGSVNVKIDSNQIVLPIPLKSLVLDLLGGGGKSKGIFFVGRSSRSRALATFSSLENGAGIAHR
jgi:hypothetical protein